MLLAALSMTLERKLRGTIDGIDASALGEKAVLERVRIAASRRMALNLTRVVNATGIVIHTNLGRSLLSEDAISNLSTVSGHYTNLEFDLEAGRRGSRYSAVEDLLCDITGAEAAMVVNNNAGAVFLCLETLTRDKKTIVSRGELVEIGGSFRIPDVMSKSGAILKEVGTTNRTHFHDYETAIESDTGLLLKVHTSNFSIVGFHKEVTLRELVQLETNTISPLWKIWAAGLLLIFPIRIDERAHCSGIRKNRRRYRHLQRDKLLGGPQAGVIVGKKEFVDEIKKNPINRALRIDKLTLAALEITLRHYRDPKNAMTAIPTLRLLTLPIRQIEDKALFLQKRLQSINDSRLSVELMDMSSKAGGGSLPLLEIPSKCIGVTVEGMAVNHIEKALRSYATPIIGRIENEIFIMDLRTVLEDDITHIEHAFIHLLKS